MTWILQQFDSSYLRTGNFISTKNWNLMSFTSGLEIGPTKRPSMCWKQIKQNTFDEKNGK